MIIKSKGKYKVVSKKTHRNLGTYRTKEEVERRIKQVEYFKNMEK